VLLPIAIHWVIPFTAELVEWEQENIFDYDEKERSRIDENPISGHSLVNIIRHNFLDPHMDMPE